MELNTTLGSFPPISPNSQGLQDLWRLKGERFLPNSPTRANLMCSGPVEVEGQGLPIVIHLRRIGCFVSPFSQLTIMTYWHTNAISDQMLYNAPSCTCSLWLLASLIFLTYVFIFPHFKYEARSPSFARTFRSAPFTTAMLGQSSMPADEAQLCSEHGPIFHLFELILVIHANTSNETNHIV
jgi:hypothetical protein